MASIVARLYDFSPQVPDPSELQYYERTSQALLSTLPIVSPKLALSLRQETRPTSGLSSSVVTLMLIIAGAASGTCHAHESKLAYSYRDWCRCELA